LVRKALASLPEPQRKSIECAFLKGLTHHELAELFGEPLGTVKTNIRRGLLRLRDMLKGGAS
jgi:RNA polymerase sigma-70 factor (ECF subfamily)